MSRSFQRYKPDYEYVVSRDKVRPSKLPPLMVGLISGISAAVPFFLGLYFAAVIPILTLIIATSALFFGVVVAVSVGFNYYRTGSQLKDFEREVCIGYPGHFSELGGQLNDRFLNNEINRRANKSGSALYGFFVETTSYGNDYVPCCPVAQVRRSSAVPCHAFFSSNGTMLALKPVYHRPQERNAPV